MQITYLDGRQFSRAIVAGYQWLHEKQQRLNDINVYPVPDGDTGTNMAFTMQSVAESLHANNLDGSIGFISDTIAESALNGARGNSGAILAQFFFGLAEGFKGRIKITTGHFSEAVHRAVERSYEALSSPREGTILTVIKDWGNHVRKIADSTHDFSELLHSSLQAAKISLEETPKKLKILAKARVVDAGAQGFVYMLEGIFHFIKTGKIDDLDIKKFKSSDFGSDTAEIDYSINEITYRYCTEFYLVGEKIPTKFLRDELSEFGDSLIVAGSETRSRIHIHTDNPRQVFDFVQQFGQIKDQKMDDMKQQHFDVHEKNHAETIALVTDSSCDLPEEILKKLNVHTVPVRIYLDETEYVDKVTIQPEEFYSRLKEAKNFPKTSQPPAKDFIRVFESLSRRYETVVSIQLSGALSGTYQAGLVAGKRVSEDGIRVIDSKTTCVALGLIVKAAGEALKSGMPLNDLLNCIDRWIKCCKMFVSVMTVEYLVRGGRLNRSRGILANILNLRPIISISPEGKTKKVATTKPGLPSQKKVMELVVEEAAKMQNPQFSITHVESPGTAEWYRQEIKEIFDKDEIIVMPASPALGAHAGPGAAAVAVMDL